MARSTRTRAIAVTLTPPPPSHHSSEDEEGPEDEGEEEDSRMQDVGDDVEIAEQAEDDEDGDRIPQEESDAESQPATPLPGRNSAPRKRGRGRWGRRGSRKDAREDRDGRETGSDAGTPRRRGGWRGRGSIGGRWGKPRGGPSHITQVPLDKEGNMADVKDDEVELPEDPEGEAKVDKNGNLLGDREYRVRTFCIEGKGDRLYMLSTEPARCIGFRDSYLFFQKHPHLFKIILEEDAKKDLIDRSIIPHSYKGRAIGVVTARSVFREFGAKIIIRGKKITDDYHEAVARAQGAIEGELAVEADKLPAAGEEYDRNRFVAWHGASAVYHTGAPSIPLTNGKPGDGKKRKFIVTGSNWMFEHAREASRFNAALAGNRRLNLNGIYDVHTNALHYPMIMQPTHARWEYVPVEESTKRMIEGQQNQINEDSTNGGSHNAINPEPKSDSIFPPISAAIRSRFLITDSYFESPVTSSFGYPGPDGAVLDVGPPDLSHVPQHVLDDLPEECRQAFYEARNEERRWQARWNTQGEAQARSGIPISYNS